MSQEIIIQPSEYPTKVTIYDPEYLVQTTTVPNNPPSVTATASSPTLPDGKILLNATIADDGQIKSIKWEVTQGQATIDNPNAEDTFATVSAAGQYKFRITVTDDKDAMTFMDLTTTVQPSVNEPPTANAGQDIVIATPGTSVELDGSRSSDQEGKLIYEWVQTAGPNNATFASPNSAKTQVTGLVVGQYTFQLIVTDEGGKKDTDETKVTVQGGSVPGQTTQLSFQQITSDYTRPFGGMEKWIDQWQVNIPNVSQLDEYDRFGWGQLAASWTPLDNKIKACADKGGKFGFGIMTYFPGAQSYYKEAVRWSDGSAGLYPESVHKEMQASNFKDVKKGTTWCPNWNAPAYLSGLSKFYADLYSHLNTVEYKGRKLKEYINYIDIRGYGQYGEWHMYQDSAPAATEDSLMKIINAHASNIPDIWLVSMSDGLTRDNNDVTTAVSYYLLTGKNKKGKFGIRKDHMGSQYFPSEDYKYSGNNTTYNGQRLGTLFAEGWKTSPYVGEPALGNSNGYAYMDDDCTKYHFSVVGNGNYGGVTASNIVQANKVMGYRLTLNSGTLKTSTGNLEVSLQWSNTGQTPVYEDFDVLFELRQGNTVVKSLPSQFTPTMFLPGGGNVTDVFTGIPSGTYDLRLKIINPNGYRTLPLSIQGRQSDGSYILKTGITL